MLVRTDLGVQYVSGQYLALAADLGITMSMSRKANSWDNAAMKSFFKTLKRELINDDTYNDHEQARMSIFRYIETYYNEKRLHSSLGWVSPNQFEALRS
ncbi:MAG: integrase core domain-containing protein [Burkholderiaceae bacterium]